MRNSNNYINLAFASLIITTVFAGCTYKHEGKLVKDVDGRIYKLKGTGRIGESYFLNPIDTIDYERRFK